MYGPTNPPNCIFFRSCKKNSKGVYLFFYSPCISIYVYINPSKYFYDNQYFYIFLVKINTFFIKLGENVSLNSSNWVCEFQLKRISGFFKLKIWGKNGSKNFYDKIHELSKFCDFPLKL